MRGPAPNQNAPVSGRTVSDAVVEVLGLLGRAGPYAVFLVIILYSIQQVVIANNEKFNDIQKARTEALEKNSTELDRLNKIVRDNAADMERLRTTQFEGIAKAIELGRVVTGVVLTNQDSIAHQRDDLQKAQNQLIEVEKEKHGLAQQMDELKQKKWEAENIIEASQRILAYLGDPGTPSADRTDLSRRFASADPNGMSRAADGSTAYGTFRIVGTAIADFIGFVDSVEPSIALRLNDVGGANAAISGTGDFISEWKSLSRDKLFDDLQVGWVDQRLYRPFLAGLGAALGRNKPASSFSADQHSLALQAVLWSVAVQEGRYTRLVQRAWTGLDVANSDDRRLICAIFNERMNVSEYLPAATKLTQTLLRARYRLELREALRMLAAETSSQLGGDCQ
jgi:hypothetical protein